VVVELVACQAYQQLCQYAYALLTTTWAKAEEKNLVQHCCKPECLQHLTKRRIDPTRSNNNTTKTLSAGPAGGVYPPFCEGLQTTLVCSSAAPNFFPFYEGLNQMLTNSSR
jgi:hypothetical protein